MSTKGTVDEVLSSLRNFGWSDYAVFVILLIVCAAIGIYFSLQNTQGSPVLNYLVGGRNLHTLPVALSIIASVVSGIGLLGTSTEVYLFGIHYAIGLFPGLILIVGLVMHFFVLPVIHSLRLISLYEYLELRFDKSLRLFGSVLYLLSQLIKVPIMIYVSATAFEQSLCPTSFQT